MTTTFTITAPALVGMMAMVSPARAQHTGDIIDTAVAAGSFTTLAKAMLRRVLTYHVVPGRVMAADVVKVTSAKAVSGDSLPVKVSGATVMVGPARVVKTDIAASNGVIHVIDTVLLPPGK
jgi:hypothetical protein